MEILLSLCAILVLYFFAWVANGSLPFAHKYSHSSRLFLYSLICLGMVPLFLFLYRDIESSFLMTMALVIESAIFSFLADEKMYEELISGYKENKERESDRKAVTRKLQKSIRENKKQEQRRDEERELAHLHMGGGL